MSENVIWTETRGTEEIAAEIEHERKEREELLEGMARCSVCGGKGKIVEFGLEGNGVWVGCDRSAECSRYIEIHTAGWSVRECGEEGNKYNTGIYLWLRRVKRWFFERFGAENRRKVRENKEILVKNAELDAKRREIFGVEGRKKSRWWRKIWRKGKR